MENFHCLKICLANFEMDVSEMKTAQLPLDFSLNVKTDGVTNLNIHVKTNDNTSNNMLISSEKNSQSAFKVVTPKHADGMSIIQQYMIHLFFLVFFFVYYFSDLENAK